MDLQKAIDFESFYFHSLLESIKKSGQVKLDQSRHAVLIRFVDFLSSGKTPLETIEKLARVQGTSDLSIFFSDMIERIGEFPPEKTVEKIGDYTSDFLEIYQELANDPQWEKSVNQYVLQPPEPESELAETYREFEPVSLTAETPVEPDLTPQTLPESDVSIRQFVLSQVHEKIRGFLLEEDPLSSDLVETLFDRLKKNPASLQELDAFSQNPVLKPAVDLLNGLLKPPAQGAELPRYFQRFWDDIQVLNSELFTLSKENYEAFEAFCLGSLLPAAPAEKSASDLEQIIEEVKEREEKDELRIELAEEDRNLRWLLRDYIVNEIRELSREIDDQMQKLIDHPDDRQVASIVMDNLKVMKDLGQIHKYPLIETLGVEILDQFRKILQDHRPIPASARSSLNQILAGFITYIDAVLNEREEPEIESLNLRYRELMQNLQQSAAAEEKIPFQDFSQIRPVFSEFHFRFIRRIQQTYTALKENPDSADIKNQFSSQLSHLKFWYGQWKLSGGETLLEVFQNWLKNPKHLDKLLKKHEQASEVLTVLASQLFTLTADEWTGYLEKLTLGDKVAEGVDVKRSLKAYVDVTVRVLSHLKDVLSQPDVPIAGSLTDSGIHAFRQIFQNSQLIGQKDLQELCEGILDVLQESPGIDSEREGEVRKGFQQFLDQLLRSVKSLPAKIDRVELQNSFAPLRTILSAAAESGDNLPEPAEAIAVSPEETEEIELDTTFSDEMSRYLEEMQECLQQLDENLYDEQAMRAFGNALHGAKGSAQIMKRGEMAQLAGAAEHLTELIAENQVELRKPYVALSRRVVKALQKLLENKKADNLKLLGLIDEYIAKFRSEAMPEDLTKKKSPPAKSLKKSKKSKQESALPPIRTEPEEQPPAEVPEDIPVLRLKEKDPEMLEIFRNEVKDKLESMEENLNLIEKFKYDKLTVQTLDRSVHEIRSAAKMLGFSEIAQLVDDLEKLLEIAARMGESQWSAIIPTFRKTVLVIRELSEKQQVSQKIYDDTSRDLAGHVASFSAPPPGAEKPEVTRQASEFEEKTDTSALMMKSYLQEAREYTEELNFLLMKLEKDPQDETLINHLMRSLHTLKGSSAMMNQREMEKILHGSEELVERVKEVNSTFPPAVYDVLFQVVDEIEFMISSLETRGKVKVNKYDDVLENLNRTIQQYGAKPSPVEKPPLRESEALPSGEDQFFKVTQEAEPPAEQQRDAHIRLNVSQMDNLLNEAAELVINNNQFKNQLERFKSYIPRLKVEDKNLQNVLWQLDKIVKEQERLLASLKPELLNEPVMRELQKSHHVNIRDIVQNLQKFQSNFSQALQGIKDSGKVYEDQLQKISRLSGQIHDEIIQARLVPMGMLFQRFHRPLRDLAKKFGKKIQLYLEGESTELDRILVDELYEPMLHLLRNAIDHGIETAEMRRQAGKPEEGLIKIIAVQERNFVLISVEDDGKGIDLDQIRERIVSKGMLKKEEVQKLSPQELYEFLMFPGFSTVQTTTTLSGRGIGLDVVRSNVLKIKGDLRIYSQPGKFTRMSIRVPISITVTQAMLVEVSKNNYAIPLLQVEETMYVNQENLILREGGYFIAGREGEIPVIHMSHLLNVPGGSSEQISRLSRYPVIIVQDEGKKAALLVDKIMQREEILIKSMGPMLHQTRYIMGGSILADGRVVLVLDIPQVVFGTLRLRMKDLRLQPTDFTREEQRPAPVSATPPQKLSKKRLIQGRPPQILVVDDSLSVRKFLSGMLNKHGYEVELAKNGQMAIDLLNGKEFDLVITDLEMPQLSGYELIEQIRSDRRWDPLPIIVLTGRASKHIEPQSSRLGANEFVVKPFKEPELLEKIRQYITMER